MSEVSSRTFPPDITKDFSMRLKLGGGGMGEVYLALERNVDRLVAIKMLRLDMQSISGEIASRLKNEARTLAQLSHPHIVIFYQLLTPSGSYPAIVMEYVEGPTLREILDAETKFSLPRIRQTMLPVAQALVYAHSRGVVHRDLKPSNVMVQWESGLTKLLDFSISRNTEPGARGLTLSTGANQIIGTPHYMAPEQWNSKPIDGRTDIYAFGVMLYEVLAGRPPFQAADLGGIMREHLMDAPPRLEVEGMDDLCDVVMWCLEKDPEKRPQSMEIVANALDRILPFMPLSDPTLRLPDGCYTPGKAKEAREAKTNSQITGPKSPTALHGVDTAARLAAAASATLVSGEGTPPTIVDSGSMENPTVSAAAPPVPVNETGTQVRRGGSSKVVGGVAFLGVAAALGAAVYIGLQYGKDIGWERTIDARILAPIGRGVAPIDTSRDQRTEAEMKEFLGAKMMFSQAEQNVKLRLPPTGDNNMHAMRLDLDRQGAVKSASLSLKLIPVKAGSQTIPTSFWIRPAKPGSDEPFVRVAKGVTADTDLELDLVGALKMVDADLKDALTSFYLKFDLTVAAEEGYLPHNVRSEAGSPFTAQQFQGFATVVKETPVPTPTPTPEPTPTPTQAAPDRQNPPPTSAPTPAAVYAKPSVVEWWIYQHPALASRVLIRAVDRNLTDAENEVVPWLKGAYPDVPQASIAPVDKASTGEQALQKAMQIMLTNDGASFFDGTQGRHVVGNISLIAVHLSPSFLAFDAGADGRIDLSEAHDFVIRGSWDKDSGAYTDSRRTVISYNPANGRYGLDSTSSYTTAKTIDDLVAESVAEAAARATPVPPAVADPEGMIQGLPTAE